MKIAKTFSLEQSIYLDFVNKCQVKNVSPNKKIEEFMVEFIEKG